MGGQRPLTASQPNLILSRRDGDKQGPSPQLTTLQRLAVLLNRQQIDVHLDLEDPTSGGAV